MLDHSDFQDTDIPYEIPLPEKLHLTVSHLLFTMIKIITYTNLNNLDIYTDIF